MVYNKSKEWTLESVRPFGSNVIRATIRSGKRAWTLMGAYTPPSDHRGITLGHITQAHNTSNRRNPIIMRMEDINCPLDGGTPTEGTQQDTGQDRTHPNDTIRRMETAALVTSMGLTSMIPHFKQKGRHKGRTWTYRKYTRRTGKTIGSVCDHNLVADPKDFTNCQLREPNLDTDHRAVIGTMKISSIKNHKRYLRTRSSYPIIRPDPQNFNPPTRR